MKTKNNNLINNFWKRRVATAVVTPFGNGFEYNVELYSFNKSLIGSKIIPYYQLNKELKRLGLKA